MPRCAPSSPSTCPPDWKGLGALDRDDAEAFSNEWRRTLAEHRLIGITWPKEYGGQGRPKLDQVVLAEEFARSGVPIYRMVDTTSVKMLGNTLIAMGHRGAEGEVLPDRSSRARRRGCRATASPRRDPTSQAQAARRSRRRRLGPQRSEDLDLAGNGRHGHLPLARTDPDVPKHRGISFIVCELPTPGVEVRPIRTLHRRRRVLRGVLHRRPCAGRTTWSGR